MISQLLGILATELCLEVFLKISRPNERDLDLEADVVLRMLIQILPALRFGLEAHTLQINWRCLIAKSPVSIFQKSKCPPKVDQYVSVSYASGAVEKLRLPVFQRRHSSLKPIRIHLLPSLTSIKKRLEIMAATIAARSGKRHIHIYSMIQYKHVIISVSNDNNNKCSNICARKIVSVLFFPTQPSGHTSFIFLRK